MSALSALQRIPLWKHKIPKFPMYFKGDPQLRSFLPLFWMKIIRPKDKIPPNQVHFIVHPQMSKTDIKQYLEKIYGVNVLVVRTEVREHEVKGRPGDLERDIFANDIIITKEREKRAYVVLKDSEFAFPNHLRKSERENTTLQDFEKKHIANDEFLAKRSVNSGVPLWFRPDIPKSV